MKKRYKSITLNSDDKRVKIPIKRYLVAYLDILGQGDVLRSLQSEFSNIYETDIGLDEEIMDKFASAAIPVLIFRDSFNSNIEIATRSILTKHVHLKSLKIPTGTISVSDGMFIWAELDNTHELIEMLTLNVIFIALGLTYFALIADGIYFRGAVTISYGFEHPKYKDYYGPGLARSYAMESMETGFPRIILDDNIMRLLGTHIKMGKKEKTWAASGKLAYYLWQKYIVGIKDQSITKNTLFPAKIMLKEDKTIQLYNEAMNNVIEKVENNTEHKDKYEKLLKLFQSVYN